MVFPPVNTLKDPFTMQCHDENGRMMEIGSWNMQSRKVMKLSVCVTLTAMFSLAEGVHAQAVPATGTPGSASATTTIDGKQLPPATMKKVGVR